jgi:hypothetical protein
VISLVDPTRRRPASRGRTGIRRIDARPRERLCLRNQGARHVSGTLPTCCDARRSGGIREHSRKPRSTGLAAAGDYDPAAPNGQPQREAAAHRAAQRTGAGVFAGHRHIGSLASAPTPDEVAKRLPRVQPRERYVCELDCPALTRLNHQRLPCSGYMCSATGDDDPSANRNNHQGATARRRISGHRRTVGPSMTRVLWRL